jgi:hypothetical protein
MKHRHFTWIFAVAKLSSSIQQRHLTDRLQLNLTSRVGLGDSGQRLAGAQMPPDVPTHPIVDGTARIGPFSQFNGVGAIGMGDQATGD